MKTLARFCLCLSGVILLCLMAGCTSEVETTPGETPGQPENPQANDPNRRSVVISLQNKLILVKGMPEYRAVTRDGIAEDDENRIGSFDIYAFGSDKEEGPYTFQERFAYRSEAGKLPAGASPLELKADEAAGKVNVVFYPRKGLFTKFYCVANQSGLTDAAGMAYTDYQPLQQTSQAGISGDVVTVPGIPTENDFVKLSTPLLQPTGFLNDVLLAPLPMSGANVQPTDLREYSMGTYVRLNISLVRAVARFDVVNDEAKSHFTITDIAMGNGRQGVTLFPIRPVGDVPATPGQLITYPYRPFDGLNANAGVTTKAFYCYPCKAVDDGFLILKGLYAVNLTDKKEEVSYRIPFERVTDGDGTRIEINHNHRYTVQITEADPFELKANIRLVDWETGDYIEDYVPDNGLETIVVDDLTPVDETTYDGNTNIVTLLLKPGSSFTVATGSNAGVDAKLTYYGGTADTEWLKFEEIPVTPTRAGTTKQVKYKVSFNENYTGDSYPRGILHLTDKAGGGEEVVLIDINYGIPEVESTGGEMSPAGVNNWDVAENTLYLVQTADAGTSSTGKITVTSAGGSKIELPANSGITVTPTSSMHTTQEYTFHWDATDAADLAEKEIVVNVLNNSDHTKVGNIKVKLLPNRINNLKLTTAPSDIKLSDITTTTATLTVPIIKDKQFTLTMDNYSKPTVSKCPSWLTDVTPASTRSTPESKTASFTFKLNEDAANFDDTTLVFANASGGKEMTVNIARQFQVPTVTYVSSDPSVNSYNGTLNLYQLKQNNPSKVTLKVYSLGGSVLQFPGNVTADVSQANTKEQSYVISYNNPNTSYSLTDVNGGVLYVKNLSDQEKSKGINVTFKSSLPKVTSNRDGQGITCSQSSGGVVVYVRDDWGTYGETGFIFTFISPVGYNFSSISTGGNADTRTTISTNGSQTGSTGSINNRFTLSFNSSTTLSNSTNLYYYYFAAKDNRFPEYNIDLYMYMPVYKGKTPYKLNGLYAMPYYSGTWNTAVSAGSNAGSGWRLASMADYRKLVGWTGSNYNDYENYSHRTLNADATYVSRIFKTSSNENRHWSTDAYNDQYKRTLDIESSTVGYYGHPDKAETQVYILVHN